jgi:hypothetical protein
MEESHSNHKPHNTCNRPAHRWYQPHHSLYNRGAYQQTKSHEYSHLQVTMVWKHTTVLRHTMTPASAMIRTSITMVLTSSKRPFRFDFSTGTTHSRFCGSLIFLSARVGSRTCSCRNRPDGRPMPNMHVAMARWGDMKESWTRLSGGAPRAFVSHRSHSNSQVDSEVITHRQEPRWSAPTKLYYPPLACQR